MRMHVHAVVTYLPFVILYGICSLLHGADVTGVLTILKKGGRQPLEEFANGLVYLTGIETAAPKSPAISEQSDKNFHPRVLPIVKGQTVQFWNRDTVQHNVFCKHQNKSMDLERYPAGEFRTEIFTEPGFYKIYCNIHQQMVMDLAVLDNHYFSTTDDEGRFAIRDVPAGSYRLHGWHIYGGTAEATIVIQDQDVTQNLEITSTRVLRQIRKHKDKYGRPYSNEDQY